MKKKLMLFALVCGLVFSYAWATMVTINPRTPAFVSIGNTVLTFPTAQRTAIQDPAKVGQYILSIHLTGTSYEFDPAHQQVKAISLTGNQLTVQGGQNGTIPQPLYSNYSYDADSVVLPTFTPTPPPNTPTNTATSTATATATNTATATATATPWMVSGQATMTNGLTPIVISDASLSASSRVICQATGGSAVTTQFKTDTGSGVVTITANTSDGVTFDYHAMNAARNP